MIHDPEAPDWKLTDEELVKWLGIENEPKALQVVKKLSSGHRRAYERMALVYQEIRLWEQGLGPKPKGVILTYERKPKRKPTGGKRGRPRRQQPTSASS